MKRLPQIKDLKRFSVLNKPTKVTDLTEEDNELYEDRWLLKAEKMKIKRIRNWRQQVVN